MSARYKKHGHWQRKDVIDSAHLERADYRTWINETVKTVEHVAPQEPSKTGDWDEKIYTTPGLVHCLGNLTLLPTEFNSAIKNAAWSKSRNSLLR